MHDTLAALNEGYIRAVRESDVRWFEANLAEDFFNTDSHGVFTDRDGFIRHASRPLPLVDFAATDVLIRLFGDFAIIHGRTTYTKPGGETGSGRYTDVWQCRQGRWLCIAAQLYRG